MDRAIGSQVGVSDLGLEAQPPAPSESSGQLRCGRGRTPGLPPQGVALHLREVRLEPETRNSRGRTARPAPIGAQAPSTVDGGGAFGGPDSFTSL